METIIDYREKKLIESIKTIRETNKNNISKLKVKNLAIADIIIKNTKTDEQFVIERKTEKDLLSSFSDGRYHEQKSRMLEFSNDSNQNGNKVVLVYILEDSVRSRFSDNIKKQIKGAEIKMGLRDGIFVIHSKNVNHTALIIFLLEKNMNLISLQNFKKSETETRSNHKKEIKNNKKDSNVLINGGKIVSKNRGMAITNLMYDRTQLTNIPSIGIKTANCLLGTYNNVPAIREIIYIKNKNFEKIKKIMFKNAESEKYRLTGKNIEMMIKFL